MFKRKMLFFVCVSLISNMAYAKKTEKAAQPMIAMISALQEPEQTTQLIKGRELLQQGKAQEAIGQFNTVIAFYEKKYTDSKTNYYTSRSSAEGLRYLFTAITEKKSGLLVPNAWGDAYYMAGYAYMELHDFINAKAHLEKAIKMAPQNSLIISELGNVYQAEGNWKMALELFTKAETMAGFALKEMVNFEISRAKRGMGYSLSELGRLDEAEKKYKECLEIDKNDLVALNELKYIVSKRNKNIISGI